MDLLPPALLRPQPEVVIAGFPVRKVVRHHSPGSDSAEDVEDPIHDVSSGAVVDNHAESAVP